MRSALFVDFNNIVSSFSSRSNPRAAEYFERYPDRWLKWLEEGLKTGAETPGAPGRRILIRNCYFNPDSGRSVAIRRNYVDAGFRVIDCPTLTTQGKNSADIHMVLDIADAIFHPTRIDEFIIVSGDTDFLPVLLRLRSHDRRSVIIPIREPRPAYAAVADHVVAVQDFVREALGLESSPPAVQVPAVVGLVAKAAASAPAPLVVTEAVPQESDGEIAKLRTEARTHLLSLVRASPRPVPLGDIAGHLDHAAGGRLKQTKWCGHGTFMVFVACLPPMDLEFVSGNDGSRALHDRRGSMTANEVAASLLARIGWVTGVPARPARDFLGVYKVLASDPSVLPAAIKQGGAALLKRLAGACATWTQRDALFVLNAARSCVGGASRQTLAAAVFVNVLQRCAERRLELTEDERNTLAVQLGCEPTESS